MRWTRLAAGHATGVTVWEGLELQLAAEGGYANPYTDVEAWVDLEGPAFKKRVYGFWDGGATFKVRMTAVTPGQWRWTSGSNQNDKGLNSVSGSFVAEAAGTAVLGAYPNLHGMIGITPDRRGLQYADGTPFFLLADTWWSLPTFRFPLPTGEPRHAIGPDADLRDYLEYRGKQGFNSVALLAAMPAWATDGHPSTLYDEDGTLLRNAWKAPRSESAMNMHNEGGRPFLFPGKVPGFADVVPDYDRINPEFFKVLDTKMDIAWDLAFVPFLEVARRDTGPAWQKYHDWPSSYVRFIHYVFTRYQAHNAIFSPIHYDSYMMTIPAQDYNEACNAVVDRYGHPPFGTLLSANANPSTLANFGEEGRWLDVHQTGNTREHHSYWWMAEMYHAEPIKPAFAGEPYYSGLYALGTPYTLGREGNTPKDDAYVRSGMYGSLLQGGYAGYIYGAEGVWQSAVEEGSRVFMWDAFQWSSARTVRHLKTFALVRGADYRTLIPCAEALTPSRNAPDLAYEGWCYAAGAPDKSWYLIYFEEACAETVKLRGATGHARYRPAWFDPRSGEWQTPGEVVTVAIDTMLKLPARPDGRDWGLLLERVDD
ncbi:MAG: DUF4038 domain-containing protein [Hyphomicrobiales bacterium]